MSEESIVSKLLPEWDDCITIADYRPDVAPLPPPITRERAVTLIDELDDGWMADAACIGEPQSWWYPPLDFDHLRPGVVTVEMRALEAQAKEVCATCPVKADCLAFSLVNEEEFGVWGGLDARERSELRVAAGMRTTRFDRWARRRRQRAHGADHRPPPMQPTSAEPLRSPA